MPGYDLHPGVDAAYQFPPEVRAAIVAMTELQTALTQVYDNARNRANHTGTQLAATISDFSTAVRTVTASETAVGVVERATTAEVQAMTDTSRYISPAGLSAAAVSAATANRIVRRDSTGRAQVADPAAAADITNKGWVESNSIIRLTTAARNTLFGSPATDAERVALANKRPMVYNTDLGWVESYYATTGLTGLTAKGLVTGTASGWYPVANGPEMYLVAGGGQSMANGQVYSNWALPGSGKSWRKGGATFLTHASGVTTALLPGRYRVFMSLTIQAGSGEGLFYIIKNNSNSDPNVISQVAIALAGSFERAGNMLVPSIQLAANDNLRMYIATGIGAATINPSSDGLRERLGLFTIEYVGPALVNE